MSPSTPTILKEILSQKAFEVSERSAAKPLQTVRHDAESADTPRGFIRNIERSIANAQPAVIAEIKKASPSKGIICDNFAPSTIAEQYETAGASCLSVLTDKHYFQGDEKYLQDARAQCTLPVLRKDFMIDPYQVYETRALGADCILLIAAAFINNASLLKDMAYLAHELSLDVLLEVHDEHELDMAMDLPCRLLGINNRDLHTFNTDLNTTLRLHERIPSDRITVTESGIHNSDDVAMMRQRDIHAFLVGEAFMKTEHPGNALQRLFF